MGVNPSYIYSLFTYLLLLFISATTFRLSAWLLQCDVFDGDEAAGPIPTLFSQEPDVTSQNILDNLVKAHNDLQRLAKVFFLMEAVSQDDCPALLKKPR